ncbi:MAG: hypothetical protein K2N52_01600, partial [Clostridia bacterium]|nr:hypothetical protein [Clostridia bacterium]
MNNKKIVSFVLAAAMATTVGLAAGCNPGSHGGGDDTPEKLAAPVVTLSGNVISWNAVDHADAYDVYEGTSVVSEAQTSCSYTINKTVEGAYEYTVVATSSDENYTDSDKSNVVTYNYSATDTSTKFTGKIYVVGDSTVCSFKDDYYLPRYGYGTQLYNYINCDASQIVNIAASGRSSYSYMVDNKSDYDSFVSNISAGDYLIIGFGHNDEKREVKRYADPTLSSSDTSTMIGSYNTERAVSFKYILKHYYIDAAIAKGATPILCTPITRLYTDDKKSSYDTGHTTTTQSATDTTVTPNVTTNWNGGDYAQAIRDLAEEQGLLCIDLNATTVADYKALGYDEASKYHAATGAKWADADKTIMEASGLDATHTNLYGAKVNAYYIASAVKASSLPLSTNVRTNIKKPTYEENATAIINSSYTIPDKEPFNPATDAAKLEHWGVTGTTTDDTTGTEYKWYGTSFGASSDTTNFTITQGTDGEDGLTFTLKAAASSGKIESGGDSLAAV